MIGFNLFYTYVWYREAVLQAMVVIVHGIGNLIGTLIIERRDTAPAIVLLRPIAHPVGRTVDALAATVVEPVVVYFPYDLVFQGQAYENHRIDRTTSKIICNERHKRVR